MRSVSGHGGTKTEYTYGETNDNSTKSELCAAILLLAAVSCHAQTAPSLVDI